MVAWLGNRNITPDALCPAVADKILATRHLSPYLRRQTGLTGLKDVSVIQPGVLGQTGMEAKEIIEGAVERLHPDAIIIVDALAAREVARLGRTVQLSNTGIAPGSGVGNSRTELSEKTLGVKCVTVGVPTVVDASTLCYDLIGENRREHESMIVTPRDFDRMIENSGQVIAYSLNIALQPDVDAETLISCV